MIDVGISPTLGSTMPTVDGQLLDMRKSSGGSSFRHCQDSQVRRDRSRGTMSQTTLVTHSHGCEQTNRSSDRKRQAHHRHMCHNSSHKTRRLITLPYRLLPTCLLHVIILSCVIPMSESTVPTSVYPPAVNMALKRPISVSPDGATCGSGNKYTNYCESYAKPVSIDSCTDKYCQLGCTFRSRDPDQIIAFDRVASGWGSCIGKEYNDERADEVVHFKGEGTDACYLQLNPAWMAPIFLHGIQWSLGVTFWIKPESTGVQRWVIKCTSSHSK